jgi:hypothetical protein
MRLFVSLFAYAFGKIHFPHVDAAAAREIERGEASTVPGFRTLHRLRKLVDEIELHTDHSTLIARARDRAAGRFLRSTCDQWIGIDDDVDADAGACMSVLTTVPDRILSAAMRMRTAPHDFNVVMSGTQSIPTRTPFRVRRVGMGMIRIPRAELAHVTTLFRANEWDEPDPTVKIPLRPDERISDDLRGRIAGVCTSPGVFLPTIRDRQWLDDDWSFCERANDAAVELWSIILPGITHGGISNLSARR